MDSILPRLLALVRPAFDLVLKIKKICVQACGCKIVTQDMLVIWFQGISSKPTFRAKKKKRSQKKVVPEKKGKRVSFGKHRLKMQPGAKLRRMSWGYYFAARRLHAAF